ncbi:MAG: hypothetical protein ACJARU_000930, partial [Congregibacter sp.]
PFAGFLTHEHRSGVSKPARCSALLLSQGGGMVERIGLGEKRF